MAWNIVRACRSFLSRRTAKRLPYQKVRRPWLEQLEDRLAPATVTWGVDTSANWNTPGGWLDDQGVHRVPGAGDVAVINRSVAVTVTIDSTQSVGGLQVGAQAKLEISEISRWYCGRQGIMLERAVSIRP